MEHNEFMGYDEEQSENSEILIDYTDDDEVIDLDEPEEQSDDDFDYEFDEDNDDEAIEIVEEDDEDFDYDSDEDDEDSEDHNEDLEYESERDFDEDSDEDAEDSEDHNEDLEYDSENLTEETEDSDSEPESLDYDSESLDYDSESLTEETEDSDSESEADDYGVTVSLEESGLNRDEDSFEVISSGSDDFISSNGNIVVQDRDDDGERFKLIYIDISNIAVTNRIRVNKNVDDLVQSIKSTGLLNPLTVAPLATDGLYVLIHGYRRIIACAKAGIKKIPCIVNTKINVPDVPILEALYNHSCSYTMREIVDYINYLEKEKGISSASMIEYLLQMDSGDYTKLKDILTDDDDDIVTPLMNGQMTIAQAFKKLEQRRKKESKEEKELKKAEQVYGDSEESGADKLAGSGEEADEDSALTDDEIASLAISNAELDSVENESLDSIVNEGENIQGFEPHKQDYHNREMLDPALRKAVLARDNNTCQCCGLSGQEYTEVLDVHHKVEVYLGGSDDIDNLITVCTVDHKLIHLFGRGDLHIRPESELTEEEKVKFKKIVKLGTIIRKGMAMKGMKREDLKKVDNADTIGRTKPGTGQVAG